MNVRMRWNAWGLVGLLTVAGAGVAWAAGTPGTLDTGYGGDGISITQINTSDVTTPVGTAMDTQGRVLYAGYRRKAIVAKKSTTYVYSWHVVRTNATGDLDPTFSDDGQVDLYSGAGGQSGAQDVAADPSDRVLLVGSVALYGSGGKYLRSDLRLVRLLANGNLDTSFASSGVAALPTSLAGNDAAYAVEVQPDGKILVGGSRSVTSSSGTHLGDLSFIARFLSSGALDTTYASGGIWVSSAYVSSRIVRFRVDGLARLAVITNDDVALRSSTGSLLWQSPKPFTSFVNSYLGDVAFDASGNVLISGQGLDGVASDFVAARFLGSTGVLDTSFNGSGVFASGKTTANTTWATSFDAGMSLLVQADGKIVLAGTCQPQSGVVAGLLLRLNADGTYDSTFGPGADGPGVSQPLVAPGVKLTVNSHGMRVYVHPTAGDLVYACGAQDLNTLSYERAAAYFNP